MVPLNRLFAVSSFVTVGFLSACASSSDSVITRSWQVDYTLGEMERECRFDAISDTVADEISARIDADQVFEELWQACPELKLAFLSTGEGDVEIVDVDNSAGVVAAISERSRDADTASDNTSAGESDSGSNSDTSSSNEGSSGASSDSGSDNGGSSGESGSGESGSEGSGSDSSGSEGGGSDSDSGGSDGGSGDAGSDSGASGSESDNDSGSNGNGRGSNANNGGGNGSEGSSPGRGRGANVDE